jgi:hypothetical protein
MMLSKNLSDQYHVCQDKSNIGTWWISLDKRVFGSKMALNYRMIVERYTIPNGVIGGSIFTVKSSLST